ncbi:translation elongation factor IF5A [Cryptococcus amylolentus CBS 6039]|uniref:Eukaryotic translation initiation factor 5A n=1 Tax=Cryptococcus amylolentus CBS 6039 TaxID=1295533 RepID=A0A1E3HZQ3_9TREE|nr:translation elongation factor IF5A [Cryptococcus amylolentus CBS 6039]ODN81031.1 translation elongation factor IF5A [Cryptococcus amylolentus CBS 6039]
MDEIQEQDFESAQSTADGTLLMQCSALQQGDYVAIQGRPCKIIEVSTSQPDENGETEVHLVAIDIFTGKTLEATSLSNETMESPIVTRQDYQILDTDSDDGYLILRDSKGGDRQDIRIPAGDLGQQIIEKEGKDLIVTVLGAMGEEQVMSYREGKV